MGCLGFQASKKLMKQEHQGLCKVMEDSLPRVLLLMVQKSSPVEVGSFSHYLRGFMSFQTVVGWAFGISSSSTVVTSNTNHFIIRKIPSSQQPPGWTPFSQPFSRLKLVKKPEVLLEMPADTVVEAAEKASEDRRLGGEKCWNADFTLPGFPPIHGGVCGKWNHMLGGGN